MDPVRDREIINIELGLADLASVEKRLDKTARAAKSGDAQAKVELRLLEAVRDALAAGRPARAVTPTDEEAAAYRSFNLLTAKPVLYAANVAEDEIAAGNALRRGAEARARGATTRSPRSSPSPPRSRPSWPSCAPEDRAEFLASLGLTESGLDRLAHAAYHLLGLQSYFTAGEKEVRAWTIHRGDKAPAAAGRHPLRFREGVHPGGDGGVRGLRAGGWLEAGPGAGTVPGGGEGIRGPGRRRDAVPFQQLSARARGPTHIPASHIYFPAHNPSSSAPTPARGDLDRRKVS